jgi:streptogramin lyase
VSCRHYDSEMSRTDRAVCLGVALLALTCGAAQAQVVTEFSAGITAGAVPLNITAGPDGNLWFTEIGQTIGGGPSPGQAPLQLPGRIGRITPLGVVTEFSITSGAQPGAITAGPDGNLWFTASSPNEIGRITPLGVVTEFGVGITAGAGLSHITAGPDGNVWFTEGNGNRIGRITPLGVVTEFGAGITASSDPFGITAGHDGNLWFTEELGGRIGRITPLGVVTEFSSGISPFSTLGGVAAGPDGNLWFTEQTRRQIGRITPLGVVTEFSAGITESFSASIALGSDGNLWFTEDFSGKIGRITPLGVVAEFVVRPAGSSLFSITAGPDGNLWFIEFGVSRIARITTGPARASSFYTIAPCRVLDTRDAPAPLGGPALAAGAKRDFVVTGTCGIPAEAVSISANVTVTEPTSAGALLSLPAQLPVVTFQAGMTRASNAFLLLAPDGSGTLSFSSDMPSGTVHLIVDVNGWWQ